MGSASSMTQKTIVAEVEKKYATDPKDTAAILKACEKKVKELKMSEAMEYARKKAAFALPTKEELDETWNMMDYNGNHILSLAEIDRFVIERYPRLNNKPALIRAMNAADENGDGYITRNEFALLFVYLHKYNILWAQFVEIDTNGDRRIDFEEFKAMLVNVFETKVQHPERIFNRIDKNGGGKILFREFCDFMIKYHKT